MIAFVVWLGVGLTLGFVGLIVRRVWAPLGSLDVVTALLVALAIWLWVCLPLCIIVWFER